jgi:pseudoazurin
VPQANSFGKRKPMKKKRGEVMFLRCIAIALTAIFFGSYSGAEAADCEGGTTHEIKMLNKSKTDPKMKMVFEPSFVLAVSGDCIKFIPTSKGHNAETIKGMIPQGAKKFKSKMNKELTVKLEIEGLYGIKCKPHYQMGMIALVQVGSASEDDIKKAAKVKHRGKAKDRFKGLFDGL